jgi:methylphosphonate synthase
MAHENRIYQTRNAESQLLKQLGARILSEANDLKRTPEALALDMGLEREFVQSIIAGNQNIVQVRDFIWQMENTYPISIADMWLDADDTRDGVLIMREADSSKTSRIFDRPNASGALSPYYEYRDTAMSRIAPFKPEWIKELRTVADADPDNKEVIFNNGHLMHQMTFFIGAVNFYWEINGDKFCVEMNTGDSCYIMPFVPHSFARRDGGNSALIIAVTFAGEVRRAISEIVRLGAPAIDELAGDLRDSSSYASRLKSYLDAESLTSEDLARHLVLDGILEREASALATGKVEPTSAEASEIAAFLNIRPMDLDVPFLRPQEEVVVRFASETQARAFPAGDNECCQIKDLARTTLQPNLKAFDIQVSAGAKGVFRHGLHEYVYAYGETPISIFWDEDNRCQDVLLPGDSAYIQPMTPHRFECATGDGRLLCVRVPGRLNNAVLNEYASFPKSMRKRVAEETMRWF